jgi:hypothetical protein
MFLDWARLKKKGFTVLLVQFVVLSWRQGFLLPGSQFLKIQFSSSKVKSKTKNKSVVVFI